VHAAKDDFKTDPTGNSGARIACGIIAKRNAKSGTSTTTSPGRSY
jgi:hypothetical protein